MKQFIKSLNEYHTQLVTFNMPEVEQGYRLYLTKVESATSSLVWFEVSSSRGSCPRPYETLAEAMDYITDWKKELQG